MKKMKNGKKLAICFTIFLLSAAAAIGSAVYIFGNGDAPKILGLVFILGCAAGVGSLIATAIGIVVIAQDRKKIKALQAAGLEQIKSQDVLRGPIIEDGDDKEFEKFEERTKKFFVDIVYPQGFTEFLKKYAKSHRTADGGETVEDGGETVEKEEKVFTTLYIKRNGEYFGIDDVYPQSELLEINDYILTSAEYFSQFSKILFFADDESGHCHFLLDYGKGGEPKVKYLDDEIDVVREVAGNFAEFLDNVKECTYEEYYKLLDEYDKQHDNSKYFTLPQIK